MGLLGGGKKVVITTTSTIVLQQLPHAYALQLPAAAFTFLTKLTPWTLPSDFVTVRVWLLCIILMENANPTILNPSDLPSRLKESSVKKRADGGTGIFDDLVPVHNYLNDPFDLASSSSGSDTEDVEDIDEQEIYG